MIELIKDYGRWKLICDVCGKGPGKVFMNFGQAVDHIKRNGWKTRRRKDATIVRSRNDEREDVCPECQGEEVG